MAFESLLRLSPEDIVFTVVRYYARDKTYIHDTVGWVVWSMMNQGLQAAHERLYRLSFVEIAG